MSLMRLGMEEEQEIIKKKYKCSDRIAILISNTLSVKDEEGEELRRMFADNDRVYSNSISQQTYKTKRSRKVDYYMTKPLFDDVEPSANDESGTVKQSE